MIKRISDPAVSSHETDGSRRKPTPSVYAVLRGRWYMEVGPKSSVHNVMKRYENPNQWAVPNGTEVYRISNLMAGHI